MEIEVSVKFIDEFGQIMEGKARTVSDHDYNCIDELFQHFERACLAASFSQEQIDDYYGVEKGE